MDDEDQDRVGKHTRNISSGDDLTEREQLDMEEHIVEHSSFLKVSAGVGEEGVKLTKLDARNSSRNLTLEIPSRDERLKVEVKSFILAEEEMNICEEEDETIPEESILKRINSHKGMKSYQLGKQLSCKWSTGAGPRIGCLRDYPAGLQTHALEQLNLSPRSRRRLRFDFPSRTTTPTGSNLSRAGLGCSSSL